MSRIELTNDEREFLIRALQDQSKDVCEKRSEAFVEYFMRNQVTVRPKLGLPEPQDYTPEEVRYLLFTLGGAFAIIRRLERSHETDDLERWHWTILHKLIDATENETKPT